MLKVLKVRITEDIQTRVNSELVREDLVSIKKKGEKKEYIATSLIRDYSTLSSNIILDPSFGDQEVWVDGTNETVYCRYRINRAMGANLNIVFKNNSIKCINIGKCSYISFFS